MRRGTVFTLALAALVTTASPVLGQLEIRDLSDRPARTFPEFVGTWVLDKVASTGRMTGAPLPAVTLTIETTTTDITVTRVLDLPPPRYDGSRRMATNNPPPEVYRFNGSPTYDRDYAWGPQLELTFALVADSLALTVKRIGSIADLKQFDTGPFTAVTDAITVNGDVLTLHRQLTSVTPKGELASMATNNLRHTYIYRRAPAPAAE